MKTVKLGRVVEVSTGTGEISLSAKGVHRELYMLCLKFASKNVSAAVLCANKENIKQSSVVLLTVNVPWLNAVGKLVTPFSYFTTFFFTLKSVPKVIRYANSKRDILHVNFHLQVVMYASIRQFLHLRFRIVYTPRGIAHYRYRALEVMALKYADSVIALTPHVKNMITSLSEWLGSKVKVVPIPPTSIPNLLDPVRDVDQSQREKGLVISVGSIQARKNQVTLIKAISRLSLDRETPKLVLIGSLDDKDYLEKARELITRQQLPVTYVGSVPNSLLYKYYSRATLMCLPTLQESQCVAILEAMYFGLPVITSDINPIRDLIKGHESAVMLVPPMDDLALSNAIRQVLGNQSLRARMAEEARKLIVDKYTWDKFADSLIELYEEVIRDD